MLYVVSISFDFESKKIYKIFWFVYLTIVFLISVLPIDYYYKDNIMYTSGMAVNFTYLIAVLAVIVIIIIGLAIFSSNIFYNPDSISITITDISATGEESDYYYNVNAIFSNLPSNTQGYLLKTTYYDSNGNALASTTEGLNTVDNSEYGSCFAFYNSPKYLAIDHVKVEIIHDGNAIKEATGDFDRNKADFSNDNNTTQS